LETILDASFDRNSEKYYIQLHKTICSVEDKRTLFVRNNGDEHKCSLEDTRESIQEKKTAIKDE